MGRGSSSVAVVGRDAGPGSRPGREAVRDWAVRGGGAEPAQYTRGFRAFPTWTFRGQVSEASSGSGGRARPRGPVEHDPAIAQRNVRVVTDHEVVEQPDVEEPAGGHRLGGEVQVVR